MLRDKAKIFTRKEVIKYIISCILLGSLTLVSKRTSGGALQITFLRVMIGTFFLMTIFVCSVRRATLWDYTRRQLIYLIISGVCIGLSWLIISDSNSKLGITTVTLTYSLGPGILLIVSPFLFNDTEITKSKVIGFIICSIGIFMLDHQYFQDLNNFKIIFDVLVAAVFTVVIVYCNRHLENINGLENAMFQMLIAFIIIFIIFVWRHGLYFEIPKQDGWFVLMAGIINTGLPVYLYLSSIDDLRPDIIAFVGYLRPLTTVSIAILVFKEPVDVEVILGALFILGGVAVANFFRRKKLRKNRTF